MDASTIYVNQPKYESFTIVLSVIVSLLTCLSIFIKYGIRRQNYSSQIPSMKFNIFDMWANLAAVNTAMHDKKVSLNVYLLRALSGVSEFFKKEKFFYVWVSYTPLLIITKAEAVEELLAGSKNLEKHWGYIFLHPWLGTGLLTSHGKKWKSRRKLLQPTFHSDILKDFLPVFNEQSQLLVERLRKETTKQWINIMNPILLCSLDIVCETILGVSIKAQENGETEYVKAVKRASESIITRIVNPLEWMNWYYFNMSSHGRQQKKDLKLLHDFTLSIIAKKKKLLLSGGQINQGHKRKALMDRLLDDHFENQALSDEDIREEIDTFTLEGHDTTSMSMTWALYLIGLHKDVQQKIHEELDRIFGNDFERSITTDDMKDMEYLDRVFKESIRLYPSVPIIGRKVDETTLCGTKIPKGTNCLLATYCLHRDESVFPEPEKFDPDRFLPENSANRHPYAYIPFSGGPRNCVGQRFAQMKQKVVVVNILRNYTVESLDPRDKVLPAPELILRPEGPVRIKIRPRKL